MTTPKLLVLLLPSHGMEDLPDSPEEAEAEELLAAFACLSHPSAARVVNRPPFWDRADMPPTLHEGDVVLVPSSCDSWMEPTWVAENEAAGVKVIRGHQTLEQWFDAVSAAYGDPCCDDADREAFASVGLFRLLVERFARRMHNFDGVDEHRIFDAVRAAAEAVFPQTADQSDHDGDVDTASNQGDETAGADRSATITTLLSPAYDALLEYRELIHPLTPYLLDVVMLADADGDTLTELLAGLRPDENDQGPPRHVVNLMADVDCWTALLESHPALAETVTELWPKQSVDLLLGEAESCETRLEPPEMIGQRLQETRSWSRERFGRGPRVWARREYGLHPDLPALLKSAGYQGALHLTFDVGSYPETEDAKLTWQASDRTGIEAFSRLPVPAARATTFWQFPERLAESVEFDAAAAVMFVRWTDTDPWFFRCFRNASAAAEVFGRLTTFGEFLTEADGHSSVLKGKAREYFSAALAKRVALRTDDPLHSEVDRWQNYIASIGDNICGGLASILKRTAIETDPQQSLGQAIAGNGEPTGTMVFNPSPLERSVVVEVANKKLRTVVPAYGYSWVSDIATPTQGKKLVEDLTLRNEHFEIQISEKTGSLKRLMKYGRRGNFLSQHVARRNGELAADDYITAVADNVQVIEDTTVSAAIRTTGTLQTSENAEPVRVTQTFRVVRGQPWFDIVVDIDGPTIDDGNPWLQYDAVRFAWSTEFAGVSQSCGFSPTPAAADRMESPLFVEIDDDPLITILTHGRTFHRRDGRTLDSLIAVAGESRRQSRFSVAVGVRDPASLAIAAMTPVETHAVRTAKPSLENAWLASVDRRGVAILAISQEVNEDGEDRIVMRIQETNGAASTATIRLCRPVAEALARDLAGRLTDRLIIREGAIEVRLREHQMRDLVVKLA